MATNDSTDSTTLGPRYTRAQTIDAEGRGALNDVVALLAGARNRLNDAMEGTEHEGFTWGILHGAYESADEALATVCSVLGDLAAPPPQEDREDADAREQAGRTGRISIQHQSGEYIEGECEAVLAEAVRQGWLRCHTDEAGERWYSSYSSPLVERGEREEERENEHDA